MEHMIRRSAQEPTGYAQQQINNAEEQTETTRCAGRSGKTEVQREQARDDVDRVVDSVGGTNMRA